MSTPTSDFAPTDTLEGRVAVITGGTGAIGLASARRLAKLGARCVLVQRHATSGDGALASLAGQGHALLRAQQRHPFRPAHLHFMVSSPGHKVLITQVFADDSEHLASDPVFGVTAPLVGRFEVSRHDGVEVATLAHDFHLTAGEMVFPHPPIP